MPGNKAYQKLLDFLMPPWDSNEIDVELRVAGILGMQGSGKTTLAQTIASDLAERYGEDFTCLKGYWLHRLIPRAREAGVLEGKKNILIILEDATTVLHGAQARKLLAWDMVYFWRLRHEVKAAGAKAYTAKIALLINMHSYMTITKYLRNAHVMIVKSVAPRWQRFEHEDITLRWLEGAIAKELTKMRFFNNPEEVLRALSKALVVYHDGRTDIISYRPVKSWPSEFFEDAELGVEDEGEGEGETGEDSGEIVEAAREIGKRLRALREEKLLVFRHGYGEIKMNGERIRIGRDWAIKRLLDLA